MSRRAAGRPLYPMIERQQAHITYFLELFEYWRGLGREYWAARDADCEGRRPPAPLRSEEEGTDVFEYLRRLEEEQLAAK